VVEYNWMFTSDFLFNLHNKFVHGETIEGALEVYETTQRLMLYIESRIACCGRTYLLRLDKEWTGCGCGE